MVKISIDYTGQLHCDAVHEPSQVKISTDAPVDNHGLGQSFSPTDLLATALGSCMSTIIGIAAKGRGYDIEGMHVDVEKHMSADLPRRVAKLVVSIDMPLTEDHADRKALEAAALACPVAKSLDPAIDLVVSWHWKTAA